MTPKDKDTMKREKKQLRGFLAAIRTENTAIGKQLASVTAIVGAMRASQLGIELIISELEEKLGKQ